MRNLSGLRLARGYALFVPACVPRNSSPPPRCATHCPIFSSIPPQPQYSQNSSVPTSIPLMPDPCGSPDRGKSSLYGSIELQILGNKAAGRRTGHRQIGTLKILKIGPHSESDTRQYLQPLSRNARPTGFCDPL